MCGILGSVNVPFTNPTLDTIQHRGPDDFGIEFFSVNGHKVSLGHRRLSIIDLSPAGHQPMISVCHNYSIIFNGEIYNHLELRKKLPKDHQYNGHSDTETILYYLIHFGIKGICDFNGIFALAFLDIKQQKLFVARDPFGVKPLYYSDGGNRDFIFSSEIRPIRLLSTKHCLNKLGLATLLRLRYNPAPETIFGEIQKVRPGHYAEVNLSSGPLSVNHSAFMPKPPKTVNYPSDTVTKLYGEQFEAAVKRQLLADVEIGVLLSGGIDSALVAALAQKHSKHTLKTFTIGFDGHHSEDEIADAAETAQYLHLDHHHARISFDDFINTIRHCTEIVEEPLGTTSIIPMYYLTQLASKHVKVVLAGQGADEPLGGYTRYKSELLLNQVPLFMQRFLLPVLKLPRIRNEKILRAANTLGIKNEICRFLAAYEIFNKREIESLIDTTDTLTSRRIEYFYELLSCKTKVNPAERMMAVDSRMNLADDLLAYSDKISMHFSIECRVPMLDLEFMNFIESLPRKFKLNLVSGKLIHKKFAREILPDKIINRKKKGFLSPTNKWFKNNISPIKEILLSGGSNFSHVFDQKFVGEIIKKHEEGFNKEKQIFLLLCIYFTIESLQYQEL